MESYFTEYLNKELTSMVESNEGQVRRRFMGRGSKYREEKKLEVVLEGLNSRRRGQVFDWVQLE